MKKGFIHLIGMSDEGASMITYDLIGNTPLVLLEHYSDDKVKIYASLNNGILEAVLKTDSGNI